MSMTSTRGQSIVLLLADDDADDRAMTREALDENRVRNPLYCVQDGEELMDYLHRRKGYAAPGAAPTPGLILLDLNMPLKDGREALAEIKADPALRHIPIVVLSTSGNEDDVRYSYEHGASSFITKPMTFEALVAHMKTLGDYWLDLVALPADEP